VALGAVRHRCLAAASTSVVTSHAAQYSLGQAVVLTWRGFALGFVPSLLGGPWHWDQILSSIPRGEPACISRYSQPARAGGGRGAHSVPQKARGGHLAARGGRALSACAWRPWWWPAPGPIRPLCWASHSRPVGGLRGWRRRGARQGRPCCALTGPASQICPAGSHGRRARKCPVGCPNAIRRSGKVIRASDGSVGCYAGPVAATDVTGSSSRPAPQAEKARVCCPSPVRWLQPHRPYRVAGPG
jgi:hypothetical protein